MKYNRLIACMLAGALAALSFQSCLFEQEDLFDKSASERLSAALENAQKVLQEPSQGWLMYYYPDNEQLYGGYNYIVKFSPSEATVWSENIEGSYSSTYRMGTSIISPLLPEAAETCMARPACTRPTGATSSS